MGLLIIGSFPSCCGGLGLCPVAGLFALQTEKYTNTSLFFVLLQERCTQCSPWGWISESGTVSKQADKIGYLPTLSTLLPSAPPPGSAQTLAIPFK